MKDLVLGLVGLLTVALFVILGLTLTGRLVLVPEHQVVNYVDDNGKVMFSSVGEVIYYKVALVK
jgi:hypothetical protein